MRVMPGKIAAAGTVALIAGCGPLVQPVTGIGENGEVFRGSVSASLAEGGSFQVSNGAITCAGTYDVHTHGPTVSFPVICSDGRKGLGTATRDTGGLTGSGTIRMNDGSNWTFVFGPVANVFQ